MGVASDDTETQFHSKLPGALALETSLTNPELTKLGKEASPRIILLTPPGGIIGAFLHSWPFK